MKMRNSCSAIAILAVMACSAAHAQVLGGSVGGALHGSFGGELDSRSTLDSTFGGARGAADQTTGRVRDLGANARNRTESTVTTARETSEKVATSTVTRALARACVPTARAFERGERRSCQSGQNTHPKKRQRVRRRRLMFLRSQAIARS